MLALAKCRLPHIDPGPSHALGLGSSGLMLGPVICATTCLLLETWNRRHAP